MSHDHTLPLDQVGEGAVVELVGMRPNRKSSRRLAELGLLPKTKITVLKSSHGQPLIIKVRGSKLAIDRQTAHHIHVRHVWGGRRRYRGARRHGAWRRGWRRRFWRRGMFVHHGRRHRMRWFRTMVRTLRALMWETWESNANFEPEDDAGASRQREGNER